MCTITSFIEEDFSSKPPDILTLVGGEQVAKITIGTRHDISLEDDELLDVIAYPPSDANNSCQTTVTIMDNSKLWNYYSCCHRIYTNSL